MNPDVWELFEDGNGDDEVAAIIRLGHYGTLPKGVRVVTQFSEIITIRTTRANIPKVSGAPEVTDIAAGNTYMGPDVELESVDVAELSSDTVLSTDERRPKDETATGKGVVVGVVDWGFDFAHPDFLKKDGSTRILALWDQRGSKLPNSPQPFGYGIVHDREAINRALKEKDPYAALGYHPADADTGIGCHGTHVLSIAAGSGGDERPTGIAPEADLVVVHNAPWDEVDTGRLGDSVTLLEGIDFIARTAAAGNHPWVINLSMGRHGEQHDGSTLIEQGLDAAIRSAPGRAICLSAGNYFDKRIHAAGQLRPTQERKIIWEIVEGKPTYNQLEFWYSWQDKFELAVRSPDGSIAARAKIGDRSKFMVGGKEVGNVYHRGQEPNNLDNHITVYLYKEAPAGEWEITLIGEDVIDGRYHAWIERDVSCPKCQSRLRAEDADPRSTTGTICNGRRTLAVGAYNKHDPEMRLGHFSSVGPTRDGRLKPDLCAPGVSVLAARSAPRVKHEPVQLLTRMSGTSMAAPHVTGTVALMFQAAPRRLRIEETHNLLLQSARKVSVPEDIPERIGIGFLDIEEAVDAARKIRTVTSNFNQTTVQSAARPKTETESLQPQTESELYEGFNGEFAQEGFESRADVEFETEALPYFNTFHRIASDITSAFEGGKTGTLNLYDLGIISYGKHQATLHSGTLFGILKRFTELSRTTTAVKMSNYLDRVKLRDESLREDAEFIRLLKDAAKEPEMDLAQDEEFGKQYWEPAKRKAATNNIKTALGHAIFYDTKIQGGLDQVVQSAETKLGGKTGEIVNGQLISEQHSLRTFVNERIQRNLRISANQKKQAAELNEAAKKLDDAAAADPVHAEELKKQAAEKRKKTSEYAANSAALEVSSNKTRGPSFVALVESGDLNLYGGDAGKIYLKGKPGVVIVGLKPGAAIDESTPALVSPATVADSPTSTTSPQHWFLNESEINAARGDLRRELSVFSSDNLVQPLVDGKDLMSALHDDLTRTKKGDFFHLTAWRLNITQDLTPGIKPLSTSPSRCDKVLQTAAARDVRARALIWKAVVAGFNPSSVPVIITENTDARNWFNAVGGKGVIDGRYPYAGSHHQKSAIIQREGEAVAYCGGIDIAPDRWDTQSHNSDVRRTREVYAGWHDIHVRMRGPVALDIELNFRDRWNAKETPALVPHEPVPPPITDPLPHVAKSPGKHHVQVLRTFACTRDHYHEFAPKGETTCLAGYLKAIARAEKYIYIEDQYLVSEELADALAKALNKIVKLVILVPRLTDGYPAEGFNYHQAKFLNTVTQRHPDKVHVFHAVQPSTGETIYIHSKVMIIDDIYAVVGSPNVNRRSTTHDTELAAAVIDAEVVGGVCRFARDLRLNLWAEHLNLSTSDAAIADPVFGVKEWDLQAKAGTFRVRYHVTPADRDESKRRWDYISDPDGRCALKSTPEMYLAAESEWAPLSEAVESAPAARATEFVELADQIVGDLDCRRPSDYVLHEMFERAESLEALATAEFGVPVTAAQIFDSFVYPSNSSLSEQLGQRFELVALPQEMLDGQLCKGDVMVRRLDGDSGHVSIIASSQLRSKESLLAEGLTSESFNSGMYAQVVEAGALPHDSEDKFARELTDSAGRLLNDILILRLATPPPPTVITVQQPAKASGDPDFESGYETSFLESEGDDTILASASREISLQGIADSSLGKLSSDVLSAILAHGESEANELTNREFWHIHPDWSGKKLDSQDPKQQTLRAEWSVIFRRRVKPIVWLRALINQIDKYRGTLPREFLLGWIAWESDGYIKSTTTLGELGYFQIMWQGGEAKSQLHLTFEEFQKLSSDPKFSIEKGIALAEAYRQYILRSYSSVEVGSDLLWRLTKSRHAASGVLKTALNSLVKTSTPITWASVSRLLPVWMVENVNHTMQYAAKLKPLADLVPSRLDEAPEAVNFPNPRTTTFGEDKLGADENKRCSSQINEVIYGWGQYKDDVAALPPAEQAKIDNLADLVVRSFSLAGCLPLGQISIVGHADQDYHGPSFEKKVSDDRARAVAVALESAIRKKWNAQGRGTLAADSIAFDPAPYGQGATQPDPANIPVVRNRALNRRVAITISPRNTPTSQFAYWPDAPTGGATSAFAKTPQSGWNRVEANLGETGAPSIEKVTQDASEQNRFNREVNVGSIRRIPIAGLSQGNQAPNRTPEAEETAEGRAIVLIPASLDVTQPAEVLFHLHGHNIGYRQRRTAVPHEPSLTKGSVRDIDADRIEQQIEESGTPYIGVLPQGTTSSGFGQLDVRAYITEVFQKATAAGAWGANNQPPSVKRIVLTGHSGGGEPISTMMSEPGQSRMSASLGEVALFDGINGDKTELPNVQKWVLDQLQRDLNALTSLSNVSVEKYRYLNGSLRFRAYYTTSSYRPRHERLQQEIDRWFAQNAAALGGPTSEFFLMLYANYRTIAVGHGHHEVIMSVGNRLRQALAPAVVEKLSPIRADEVGKILVTFKVDRFLVFIPEKVILSTRGDFDPTPNLSVHIFFSANPVQGDNGNDVLTHGMRGASSISGWVTIGVPSHDTIRDWEVRDCLTSVGITGPITAMRLSGHSRGAESLRNTILQKKITTLNLIERVFLLDSDENPVPPDGLTLIPKSQQLASDGVDPASIFAYEVNVRKKHTPLVTYVSLNSACMAAIGYVRLIRDAMVTQPGIDGKVQANQPILEQLNSLPLPPRGSFTAKAAPGLTSIQDFCTNNLVAITAILKNQANRRDGLLHFLNSNNLARFSGFVFDQGISAHHFFAAEIAHELTD